MIPEVVALREHLAPQRLSTGLEHRSDRTRSSGPGASSCATASPSGVRDLLDPDALATMARASAPGRGVRFSADSGVDGQDT